MAQMRSHHQLAFFLSLGAIMFAGCSQSDPLDTLAQGETGRVVRIIDGDALVLDTGLSVRLVGLEAPAPERYNRAGEPYADASARLLEDLVMGRQVRLIYPGITRDRYDRALAYVRTEDRLGPALWLNREMLRRGAARARFYPDTSALGGLLRQDEAEARKNTRGLWALASYAVVQAANIPEDARGFYIITGTLGPIHVPGEDDQDLKCIRDLSGANLKLGIEKAASELCQRTMTGHTYELRGYIYEGRMDITDMLNVAESSLAIDTAPHVKAP